MSQSQLLGKSGELKNAEGTRKRLKIPVPHFDNTELIKQFDKTIIGTVGSTKMRVFNALANPRKRVGTKTGTRQGDNGKQLESKGPSNPKNDTQKH
ncbi:hypothetical protein Bca52824_039345 [Brassica carinata]|uniref:Uncharacterized protein n=1 Tax=Brassica carinata TaxID=52824 RepID=A0A8X7RQU1_BRACI|nr:hypothetical protein Bca52824_039345 [Brassica carinata]